MNMLMTSKRECSAINPSLEPVAAENVQRSPVESLLSLDEPKAIR